MALSSSLHFCSLTHLSKAFSNQRRIILSRVFEKQLSYSVYRTLLSESITRMEQYKRQRIFTVDYLKQNEKVELFNLLGNVSSEEDARALAPKVMNALHCAQSKEECQAVENVIHTLSKETDVQSKLKGLGTILMRMYHYLGMYEKAFAAYDNQESFKTTSISLVLMDLLYKNGQYRKAVDVFLGMPKYNIYCGTVALGSLYHINTPESLAESQSLLIHMATNYAVTRQAVLFSATLALNQGEPSSALEFLKFCNPDITAKNIELISLCRLKRVKDVLSRLVEMEHMTNDINKLWGLRIYRDAKQEMVDVFEKEGTPKERDEFEKLRSSLERRGVMSNRTVDVFLDRVIPGEDDSRKERAKRIINRGKSRKPS